MIGKSIMFLEEIMLTILLQILHVTQKPSCGIDYICRTRMVTLGWAHFN